jgi:hypothetical protein
MPLAVRPGAVAALLWLAACAACATTPDASSKAVAGAGRDGDASSRSACVLLPSASKGADPDAGPFMLVEGRADAARYWDAAPMRGRRVWVDVRATNEGRGPVTVYPRWDIAPTDRAAAPLGRSLEGATLAPGGSATLHASFYVPAGSASVAIHVLPYGASGTVGLAASVDCSDKTYEPGQMAAAARAVLVEGMTLYSQHTLTPPPDPGAALAEALREATGAQGGEDVVDAIHYQMFTVGDRHSYIYAPSGVGGFYEMLKAPPPRVAMRPDGIAVVRLFVVGSPSQDELVAYARHLQQAIDDAAAKRPAAWIVDLREHGGGNMWAGLAGITALLEGPEIGAFVGRGERQRWLVHPGRAGIGDDVLVDAGAPTAYRFPGPIAVLIGGHTSSSGEAIAIAFEGRLRTRFFGAPSAGATNSAVRQYTLADGSLLGIAEVRNADRAGRVYEGPIVPDELADAHGDDSVPPREAIEWLEREIAASH